MKILIVYPNLPLMLIPAMTVGIFTAIAKENDVECDLFETTAYTSDLERGMIVKAKLGNGRAYDYNDIIDPLPMSEAIPDFIKKVNDYKPDLLLFSVVEDTFNSALSLLESVQHLNIPHIFGGVFPINAPDVCINNPLINVISYYEGENVLTDVITEFKQGRDWRKVKGLMYKDGGKVIKNPPQPLTDLNAVIPNYDLYQPKRFNRPMGGRIVRSVQLETYRGCPYSCTFCNSPMTRNLNKNFLRRKSVEQVRKELDYYIEKYDPEYWFIIDDSFLARPRDEIFKLLELLQEYNIPWWCNTRLENVDAELLEAMKKAHCDRISFGIECGNEAYRKNYLKRNITNKVYLEKADVLNASGIPYSLNIIIGMPYETEELVFETIHLIKKIGGYDGLGISIFIPYYGTDLRTIAVDAGFIEKDWISQYGLQSGMALDMPKPYLQQKQLDRLVVRLKHLCYFDLKYWDDILRTDDLSKYEEIYENEFYSFKLGTGGDKRIAKRKLSPWACSSDEYVTI